jgi:beta-glucosidase
LNVRATAALLAVLVSSVASVRRGDGAPEDVVDSQSYFERALAAGSPFRTEDVQRARQLVSQMTLAEKAGQMTQLEIGMISDGKGTALRLNPEKLRKAVVQYGVGSILNVNDEALPVAQWREIVREIQAAAAQTRLKVPVLYGIDTIHGANYVAGATLFPQPLGMAATWNPVLMEHGSRVAAAETRAAGIPWNFSPVLDIGRQPLWPRLYETLGEDPYLASVMGVATVRGYQGADPASPASVAACMKHYLGYSLPTTGHDRTPALIPDRTLREYVLPPFAAAVKAGAMTVMVNSGEVNGVPGHVNRQLLTDVLRGELGFEGLVVSDWEDIKKVVTIHRAAASEKEATLQSVLAGVDMSMVPSDYSFADLVQQLVKEGALPVSRVDEAVAKVLMVKSRLGLFEDPLRGLQGPAAVAGPDARKAALQAARESITLLKNEDGVLPLRAGARVLVTGPTCDSLPALNNGWTWTWQGDRATAYPQGYATVLGALRAKLGDGRVAYLPGATFDKETGIAAAVAAAGAADVVVLCLGEIAYAETPGNIDDLHLPEAQQRLAQAIAATGKPVVLVLVEGRPRIIRPFADAMKAIVMAYNPGMEGGAAVADVLLGEVNPGGKLPITYPRFANALRPYDHKEFETSDTAFGLKASTPQFAFGSGLSYTTFAYSDLQVSPATARIGDPVTVKVTVANTGGRAGSEVVQVYVSDLAASITPPGRRLRRFAKVPLQPGQRRTLTFTLGRDAFEFIGVDLKPVAEPGAFSVQVGSLKAPLTLQ